MEIAKQDPRSTRTSMILLLTDGQATSGITSVERILAGMRDTNRENPRISVFALGLGQGTHFDTGKAQDQVPDSQCVVLQKCSSPEMRSENNPGRHYNTSVSTEALFPDSILLIHRYNKDSGGCPFLILPFLTGVDWEFLQKVCAQNNGWARRVFDGADTAAQIRESFDEVSTPVLLNVRARSVDSNKTFGRCFSNRSNMLVKT